MLLKKQLKLLISITIISTLILTCTPNVFQTNAEYNVRKGDSFRFYLDTLKKPNGANHYINYRGLLIHTGVSMFVRFIDIGPPIRYTLTVGVDSIDTILLTDIFVQETNWDELTIEYEALGYEIVETDMLWGARLNTSTIIEIDFNKKDGVVESFYAFNESQLVYYLETGEIYFYRTSESTGLKWPYSFIAIIPLGGIIGGILIYKRRVAQKEKIMEAN
ncbi:MAG: hypothetical protein FK731_12330 [Asgard group archaeon]|nr:hypothetical protein [Asgard group archaeon]